MDFCIFDLEKCDKSLFLLLSFAYNSFAAVHLLKSFTGYYLAHFLHLQYSHYLSKSKNGPKYRNIVRKDLFINTVCLYLVTNNIFKIV